MFRRPNAGRCVSRRKFPIRIRRRKGLAFKSLIVSINRRTKIKLTGLKARRVKATINLRGLPKGKVVVKVVAVTTGRKAVSKRTYRTCAAKPKRR